MGAMSSTHPDTARLFAAWGIAITIIIVLAVNLPNVGDFFSQDDFAGMNSQASSFEEFKGFFAPDPEGNRGWYRPLSFDIKFWLMRSAFGFNPVPHHILPILLHCLNIILCYFFLLRLTGRMDVPLLAAVLYGLCGAHQTSLYWVSAGVEPITAFFFLLGLNAFMSWRQRPGSVRAIGICLLYILMLLCKETAITFPVVLLLINIFFPVISDGRKVASRKSGIWLYIFLFIILVVYLVFYFKVLYKPGVAGRYGYDLTMNPITLTVNFFTYLFQIFIGNAVIYSILSGAGATDPRGLVTGIMNSSTGYILGLIGIAAIVLLIIWIRRHWNKFLSRERRYAAFGFLWFIICILPVLPFPGHNTAYYVNLALIGFSACLAGIALGVVDSGRSKSPRRAIGWVLLILFGANFIINAHLGATIAPLAKRSVAAKSAFDEMLEMHPSFEPGTLLFILDIDEDLRLILNDGLIYMSYYDDNLRWVFTIKEGQPITRTYLDVHGWEEGGPRIYYSYDGEEFVQRDEEYFLSKYPLGGG